MREPERIKRILNLIEEIWTRYPDTRFNQLMDSLQLQYMNTVDSKYSRTVYVERGNKVMTSTTKTQIPDLFYLEDDKFEKFLVSYMSTLK